MKRSIAILILLCLAITAFCACEKPEVTEEPNPASDFEYKINGEQVSITKYIGTDKTVTIPETIEGKIVTEIGYQAFAKSIITECVLPLTIRKIDGLAFALCSDLEKITLNEGLITVEHGAFAGESKLSEIIIPKTVVNIDEGAFCTGLGASGSSTLKKVVFEGNAPQNYLSYPPTDFDSNYTIYYHSTAQGFTFPRWNGYPTRVIDAENTVPLFEDFEYQENASGGMTVLAYVGSAESVTIPQAIEGKNVTEIGTFAFKDNDTVRSVTMPNTVTTIKTGAFFSCSSLTTVTLSGALTEIEAYAFSLCMALSCADLPSTLKTLGNDAFNYCTSLKSATIPAGLTDWGVGAFSYSGLESVVLENGITCIGERAFSCCALKSVVLPDSIQIIKDSAFSSCDQLESITLNEGLITIEKWAFGWSDLKSITLPSTVTSIGESAFDTCRELTSVSLNEGLQTIGDYAFQGNKALTEIIIPATVTNINESAFKSCTELTAVKFEGDAPTAYENPAADVMYGPGYGVYYTVYFHIGAQGFTQGASWHRYRTAIW